MATDCGLDDAGSNPGVDWNFRLSRPVLDPTQPFIKLEPYLSGGSEAGACCCPLTPSIAEFTEELMFNSSYKLGHTETVTGSLYL